MSVLTKEQRQAEQVAKATREAVQRESPAAAAGRREVNALLRAQASGGGNPDLWRRVFRRKETPDEAEARADEERTQALTAALDRRDATGSFGDRAPAATLDQGSHSSPPPPAAGTVMNDWIRGRGQDEI
jgi:hypothetical protein